MSFDDVSYLNGQLRVDTDGVNGADFFINLAGTPAISLTNDFIYA